MISLSAYKPAKISISLLSSVSLTIAFLVLAVFPTTMPLLFFLPSMFMVFDRVICATSVGFRKKGKRVRRDLTTEAG